MNEQIAAFIRRPGVVPTTVGVVAFASGGIAGYFLGVWKKEHENALVIQDLTSDVYAETERVEEALADAQGLADELVDLRRRRNFISLTHPSIYAEDEGIPIQGGDPSGVTVDWDAMAREEELIDEHGAIEGHRLFMEEIAGAHIVPEPPEPEEDDEPYNVFASVSVDDDWDMEAEELSRDEADPYVIHSDEFHANEADYSQTTLTWYEGDQILTDQESVPVYNWSAVTGELKFGHGSGQSNVVYIRNNTLKAEYEIIKDDGHYAQEVMGLDPEPTELRHSQRRFRLVED